jgi:hypothetical protein
MNSLNIVIVERVSSGELSGGVAFALEDSRHNVSSHALILDPGLAVFGYLSPKQACE